MEGLFAAMLLCAVVAVVHSLRKLRAPVATHEPRVASEEASAHGRSRSATLAS
jgi:hypothetical protein